MGPPIQKELSRREMQTPLSLAPGQGGGSGKKNNPIGTLTSQWTLSSESGGGKKEKVYLVPQPDRHKGGQATQNADLRFIKKRNRKGLQSVGGEDGKDRKIGIFLGRIIGNAYHVADSRRRRGLKRDISSYSRGQEQQTYSRFTKKLTHMNLTGVVLCQM